MKFVSNTQGTVGWRKFSDLDPEEVCFLDQSLTIGHTSLLSCTHNDLQRATPGHLRPRFEVAHEANGLSHTKEDGHSPRHGLLPGLLPGRGTPPFRMEKSGSKPQKRKMEDEWTENQAQIARYFNQQLGFLATLCFDRSANAIVQVRVLTAHASLLLVY